MLHWHLATPALNSVGPGSPEPQPGRRSSDHTRIGCKCRLGTLRVPERTRPELAVDVCARAQVGRLPTSGVRVGVKSDGGLPSHRDTSRATGELVKGSDYLGVGCIWLVWVRSAVKEGAGESGGCERVNILRVGLGVGACDVGAGIGVRALR